MTSLLPNLEPALFEAVFLAAPSPYLLLAPDAPKYTILAANAYYCRTTITTCEGIESILGRSLFEVFPDNPEDPNPEALLTLRQSLDKVLATKAPHTMEVQKYNIPKSKAQGGFEERYWSQVNTPVFDKEGKIIAILHYAADVTEAATLLKTMALEGEVANSLRLHNERLQTEIRRRIEAESARDRLLESERGARHLAEEASRAKSAFLARMSHEIRTPINAIVGYTELVEMGLSGPITATQKKHLHRVHEASQHLLGLVNKLLDLAKVENGHLEVSCEKVQVFLVTCQAAELVQTQALSRHLTLTNDCQSGRELFFLGDGDRVRQIVVNLLNNAIKFTPAGGKIVLSCGRLTEIPDSSVACTGTHPGSWIYISVEDSGIGISEADQSSIFEPFVQADSTLTRQHEGAGLGLAISRELARLMGGDITVTSRLNEGSLFKVWLPEIAPEAADPAN